MWNQTASSASNHRTKFVGFALQTCDFTPLTRWRRELRKGVHDSKRYSRYLNKA